MNRYPLADKRSDVRLLRLNWRDGHDPVQRRCRLDAGGRHSHRDNSKVGWCRDSSGLDCSLLLQHDARRNESDKHDEKNSGNAQVTFHAFPFVGRSMTARISLIQERRALIERPTKGYGLDFSQLFVSNDY